MASQMATGYGFPDFALSLHTDASHAFQRAIDMLRQDTALSFDQFQELDMLFHRLSCPQFVHLVQDPQHQRQLRRYEVLSLRQSFPIVANLAFGALIVAGAWAALPIAG